MKLILENVVKYEWSSDGNGYSNGKVLRGINFMASKFTTVVKTSSWINNRKSVVIMERFLRWVSSEYSVYRVARFSKAMVQNEIHPWERLHQHQKEETRVSIYIYNNDATMFIRCLKIETFNSAPIYRIYFRTTFTRSEKLISLSKLVIRTYSLIYY